MTHFNTIKYSEIVFPTKEKQTTALDKSYGNWSGIFLFFVLHTSMGTSRYTLRTHMIYGHFIKFK